MASQEQLRRAAFTVASCDDCASEVRGEQDRATRTLTVEVQHSATCPRWPHPQREPMSDDPGIEDRLAGDDYWQRLRLDRLTRLLEQRRHAREQFLATKTATVADLPGPRLSLPRAERAYRNAHVELIAQIAAIADNTKGEAT